MNHPLTAEEAKQYSEYSLFADGLGVGPTISASPDICNWIEDLGEAAMAFITGLICCIESRGGGITNSK